MQKEILNQIKYDEFILSNDFSANHTITYKNNVMSSYHMHDEYEIYSPVTENIKYFINDKLYELTSNSVLLMKSTDVHKSNVPDNNRYERYVVLFKPSIVEGVFDTNLLECFSNKVLNLNSDKMYELKHLFDDAVQLSMNTKDQVYANDVLKKICLYKILIFLNQCEKAPYKEMDNPRNLTMEKLVKYISENYHKDLSLEHLSKIFYISTYHLNKLFKEYSGFTIHNYIINIRIAKAKILLIKNNSVSLCGQMVGYNNLAHFSRVFKAHTGISPKQYLKNNY